MARRKAVPSVDPLVEPLVGSESWVEREARRYMRLNDPEVRKQLEKASAEQREADRIARLRKQMREQDARKRQDPTRSYMMSLVHVVYVWRRDGRRNAWVEVAYTREEPTPKRIARWREKFKINDSERVLILNIDHAVRNPPVSPPLAPPSKRATRKAKQVARVERVEEEKRKRRKIDPLLSQCDHTYWKRTGRFKKLVKERCAHRAPWYVSYKADGVKKRQLRRRCTRHAWYDKFFPVGARDLVRVERTVPRKKKR